jgi:hypothetical protein
MTYQTEFPDYDEKTMPIIPEGFIDTSDSSENVCPSFYNEKLNMTLYVDYADKLLREFEEAERFTLTLTVIGNDEVIFRTSSDDYDYILRAIALYR